MSVRPAALNREKLVFLLSAAALAVVLVVLAGSRPFFAASGQQRAECGVPGAVDIDGGRRAESAPGGRNPFSRAADPSPDGEKRVAEPVKELPLPKPITTASDRKEAPEPIYNVPVNFTGIYAPPEGGELYVLLKDKVTGERRRLVKGSIWPEINLRIVEINWTGVLLENEKGRRFLMRDLFGRRSSGAQPNRSSVR